MKKVLAIAASALAVASVLIGFQLAGPSASQDQADALSGSSFQAGNIITDANFYDGDAMTASQIQSFLNAQIGTCASSSCLNVGKYSLNSHGADAMCSAVTGGSSLSAATIISRVAAACNISPKVIIVTLQKEQTLISGGIAKNPSSAVLARAMGYACPDSANGGCDPAYSGVGNQVYWASWQWKRYGNPSGTSNYFTWFAPGGNRAIQYSPNASCGTKSVYVQNKATAALYYYTPYTPNTAALNNLYGTGDGCSAYGNRNFWRLFSDWFGSPTANGQPKGSLDSVTGGAEVVSIRGWAIDPLTSSSTSVDVYVDSKGTRVAAAAARSDVARAYPSYGSAHGFDADVTADPGTHKVCVYALSTDGFRNSNLGCKTVTVTKASPFGNVETAQAVPGGLRVKGWAIDPDNQKSALNVTVKVDSTTFTVPANVTRSDVARVYPSAGATHGYDKVLSVGAGTHTVCVYGVNIGKGADKLLKPCTSVKVPGTPGGTVDAMTGTTNAIQVRGWAIDGKTAKSINVDVYVDGVGRRVAANQARTDIARVFPAYGSAHGFSTTISAKPGPHSVCVYAINSVKGSNPTLKCSTVQVGSAPSGAFDSATAVSGGVSVRGWAWDPDTTAAISVDVYVDSSRAARLTANQTRTDVGRVKPAAGNNRGYSATVAAGKGKHTVCTYAIDANSGTNTTLGCKTVTVS